MVSLCARSQRQGLGHGTDNSLIVPYVLKNLICPTKISDHVRVVTRYVKYYIENH